MFYCKFCKLLKIQFIRELKKIGELFKLLFQLRYIDIFLYATVFYILANVEYNAVVSSALVNFAWERDLFPVAFQNFCLFCIPLLFLRGLLRKLYSFSLIILFFLPVMVHIYLLTHYNFSFNSTTFSLLTTTNVPEVLSFFRTLHWYHWCLLVIGFGTLICLCILARFVKRQKIIFLDYILAALLFIPMCFVILFCYIYGPEKCVAVSRISGIQAFIRSGIQYKRELSHIEKYVNNPEFPAGLRVSEKCDDIIGIIVIGESATTGRMSLYGCTRETNPQLKQKLSELIVLQNAVSSVSQTNAAFKKIFSFALSPNMPPTATLDAVIRKSGWNTKMITSYAKIERLSPYSCMTELLFKQTPQILSESDGIQKIYDENLLSLLKPELEKAEKGRNLWYLETKGSHVIFSDRIPEDEKFFSKKSPDIIDIYDDTIRYTDKVLNQLINMVNETGKPAFILYFSDHGESIWEGMDKFTWVHRDTTFPELFSVPVLIWTNKKYRDLFPELIHNASKNNALPYCTDALPYMILSLCGISYDNFPAEYDILSSKYNDVLHTEMPAWRFQEVRKRDCYYQRHKK